MELEPGTVLRIPSVEYVLRYLLVCPSNILVDIMHLKCMISTYEIVREPNLYQAIIGIQSLKRLSLNFPHEL